MSKINEADSSSFSIDEMLHYALDVYSWQNIAEDKPKWLPCSSLLNGLLQYHLVWELAVILLLSV